jgi:nucleoside-diphosphate-sugar epimerase
MIASAAQGDGMRIVVIGGTGHIGSYLTPRLVEQGHQVVNVSRGLRSPYLSNAAWRLVQTVECDRTQEEEHGNFGERIASLDPDSVIDLTCYVPELVEALRGRIGHLVHCGTIWVHGHSVELPTSEAAPRNPFGIYGQRKAELERYLLGEARQSGFPVTVLHPGHLVGVGWAPVNPQGNFNFDVFHSLAAGSEVILPNLGMETVHHVHADDVAAAFVCALGRRTVALGESFHVVSSGALTLRGYAERMAAWLGQRPSLRFLPWNEWKETVSEKDAQITFDHIQHSPNCSIAKARALLEYEPRYSSLQAIRESVTPRLQLEK